MRSHDKFTPRGIFAPRGKFVPGGKLMHINGALEKCFVDTHSYLEIGSARVVLFGLYLCDMSTIT